MKNMEEAKSYAIAMTGYTEKELMKLAIVIAQQKCAEWLRNAEKDMDAEAYRHYTILDQAWSFMADSCNEE